MTLASLPVLEPGNYYTPEEVAAVLRLRAKKRTARALDRLGIAFTPMGRRRLYRGADVLAYLARRRTPAAKSA